MSDARARTPRRARASTSAAEAASHPAMEEPKLTRASSASLSHSRSASPASRTASNSASVTTVPPTSVAASTSATAASTANSSAASSAASSPTASPTQFRICDRVVQVVMFGAPGAGKSCLRRRFAGGARWREDRYVPTVGCEFDTVVLDDVAGCCVKTQIWDVAGGARFANISPHYFRGARAVLLVLDVTNRASLQWVELGMRYVKEMCTPECAVVLVASKCDLMHLRVFTEAELETIAQRLEVPVLETSACMDDDVDDPLRLAVAMSLANTGEARACRVPTASPYKVGGATPRVIGIRADREEADDSASRGRRRSTTTSAPSAPHDPFVPPEAPAGDSCVRSCVIV